MNTIQSASMVRFSHQKFENDTPVTYELEPYVVKEHRNRWYVIGLARNRQGIRCFGLDRILADSIEITSDRYEPSAFDADAYFSKALGIAVYDEPAQNVVISMTPMRGRYFRSQPFFPFNQEDILADDETEFKCRLHMIVNKELIYELARFANEMKVISPESLRTDLLQHLKESVAFQN
nr:WYL domain-containing protein [Dyadobacter sp. NIV53]